ncbi:MAG: prephenate dehydrogenase/arogenate dehydrogenase family protein [Actinobacteria bacterium]|nr:prephenate dehydrogenase/arogenate dehydrogenase family protein [Actinomycetota bacterium]MBI3686424.1 prephenate dehydrogenase/arogenate dehydrogenase family protein [Actinomycetota bacterium]
MATIAVIGLGLVGGSLLRRLASGFAVRGHDEDPATRSAAADAGYLVAPTVRDAVEGSDLVVLATPLPALRSLLPVVAGAAAPGTLVTDVASVKRPVRDLIRSVAPSLRHVGGHPMAGTERSGFAASDPDLFSGAAWVLCLEDDTDVEAWLAVAELVAGIGCRVVPTTAEEHDRAVARISHLPHILAAVLATVGADGGELALRLAAGSFRDGTRVAGSRPELTAAMCEANGDVLADVIEAACGSLAEARDLLRAGSSLAGLLERGHVARDRWVGATMGGTELMLARRSSTLAEDLLRLGRSGGHLLEVAGPQLRCWRPDNP